MKIHKSIYQQNDVISLSKYLIGKYVLTKIGPEQIVTGGMIIETESYCGEEDRASHAYNGRRTKRTETMYSAGGIAYVYMCYGIHYLFNVVTNGPETPHGILIRAITAEIGVDLMLARRGKTKLIPSLTVGPGSVCQALGINLNHNATPLDGETIWIEDRGILIPPDQILATPRIGIDYAGEDALQCWRFVLPAR